MSFLSRYLAGERLQAWSDLGALADRVRHPSLFPDAYAVATETMTRVRRNVDTLVKRLGRAGYQFADPAAAHVPPTGNATEEIEEIESVLGPLPLSLRAFYLVVGSVDFTQAHEQLVHYDGPERATAREVEILGEEDPLVVAPLSKLQAEVARGEDRVYYCFAADEFHKANYSGGENYHGWLPDPRADFEIIGMYDIDEKFVEYLRATMAGGGFRGRVETLEHDESRCRKVAPKLAVVQLLAEGLVPL